MADLTADKSPGETALWQLFERLALYTESISHPPVHTVEEALPYWSKLAAQQTKNLFLKDAKGELWLIVLPSERRGDLKGFAASLGAKKFSFASAELLESVLGVRQGAVSPLALINDGGGKVKLALDASLLGAPRLAFHPLVNTATTALGTEDFLRFLTALGRGYVTLDAAT
ncbi:MAG: prolyl-tRNA synthetase associated domain-containing protein [Aliidongia sp.]